MQTRLRMALGTVIFAAVVATGCASGTTQPTKPPSAPAPASPSSTSVATPASATEPARNATGYFEWTVQDLKRAQANKDFVLVNVHIPFEGRIAGTDLEIPYDEITTPENLAQLPADKNARIVLYCRSGSMSNTAVSALVKLGYTNLVDVRGGMRAWEAAGNPLDMGTPKAAMDDCG